MIPYTIDAVHTIRFQAANLTPASAIQQILGWDASMLERVCRKHGIGLVVPAAPAASVAPPREPSPHPGQPIAPYPPNVARIIITLSARQAEIFRILRMRAKEGGGWVRSLDIAQTINGASTASTRRSIGMSTVALGRNLERMDVGYRIEKKIGQGGGYRLVIEEPAR